MIINIILFTIILILGVFLFLNIKKYKKTKDLYNKSISDYEILKTDFNILKTDILIDKRRGYYQETITLLSINDKEEGKAGNKYNSNVFVTETDRYLNAKSEIKLEKVEVISGYDTYKFDFVKKCIIQQFQSIKTTSDINWLESESSIVEQRKNKINEILIRMKSKKEK